MNEMWTEAQRAAIEAERKTLIVSAGAGSGKTSVLTERIMQKLKNGKDINDFLVVTFTRAAAADMKEKNAALARELMTAAEKKREIEQEESAQKAAEKD